MFLLVSIGLAVFMAFKFNEGARKIAFYLGCFSLFIVLIYPYFFEAESKSFSELFLGGFDGSIFKPLDKLTRNFSLFILMFSREFWVITFESSFLFIFFKPLTWGYE